MNDRHAIKRCTDCRGIGQFNNPVVRQHIPFPSEFVAVVYWHQRHSPQVIKAWFDASIRDSDA